MSAFVAASLSFASSAPFLLSSFSSGERPMETRFSLSSLHKYSDFTNQLKYNNAYLCLFFSAYSISVAVGEAEEEDAGEDEEATVDPPSLLPLSLSLALFLSSKALRASSSSCALCFSL